MPANFMKLPIQKILYIGKALSDEYTGLQYIYSLKGTNAKAVGVFAVKTAKSTARQIIYDM